MKYLFITLFLIGAATGVYAQDHKQEEGAIKTSNGFLLYNDIPNNSYTLELKGDVDLASYPMIKLNGTYFGFDTGSKSEFGTKDPEVLGKYMQWELDFLKEETHANINFKNEMITVSNRLSNFWSYDNPKANQLDKKITPVLKTYFMDFVYRDLLFRISYPSTTGNDTDAKQFLQGIINNFRFYKQQLDFDKLSKSVEAGVNYYSE